MDFSATITGEYALRQWKHSLVALAKHNESVYFIVSADSFSAVTQSASRAATTLVTFGAHFFESYNYGISTSNAVVLGQGRGRQPPRREDILTTFGIDSKSLASLFSFKVWDGDPVISCHVSIRNVHGIHCKTKQPIVRPKVLPIVQPRHQVSGAAPQRRKRGRRGPALGSLSQAVGGGGGGESEVFFGMELRRQSGVALIVRNRCSADREMMQRLDAVYDDLRAEWGRPPGEPEGDDEHLRETVARVEVKSHDMFRFFGALDHRAEDFKLETTAKYIKVHGNTEPKVDSDKEYLIHAVRSSVNITFDDLVYDYNVPIDFSVKMPFAHAVSFVSLANWLAGNYVAESYDGGAAYLPDDITMLKIQVTAAGRTTRFEVVSDRGEEEEEPQDYEAMEESGEDEEQRVAEQHDGSRALTRAQGSKPERRGPRFRAVMDIASVVSRRQRRNAGPVAAGAASGFESGPRLIAARRELRGAAAASSEDGLDSSEMVERMVERIAEESYATRALGPPGRGDRALRPRPTVRAGGGDNEGGGLVGGDINTVVLEQAYDAVLEGRAQERQQVQGDVQEPRPEEPGEPAMAGASTGLNELVELVRLKREEVEAREQQRQEDVGAGREDLVRIKQEYMATQTGGVRGPGRGGSSLSSQFRTPSSVHASRAHGETVSGAATAAIGSAGGTSSVVILGAATAVRSASFPTIESLPGSSDGSTLSSSDSEGEPKKRPGISTEEVLQMLQERGKGTGDGGTIGWDTRGSEGSSGMGWAYERPQQQEGRGQEEEEEEEEEAVKERMLVANEGGDRGRWNVHEIGPTQQPRFRGLFD